MQTVYMVVITGEYKAGDGRGPAHRASIAAVRSSKAEADAVLLNNHQVGPKWVGGVVEYVDSAVIDGEPNFE